MENALLLARVIAPVSLVLGLSMLLYVKAWKRLVEQWDENHFRLFPFMFLEAVLGFVIVNMYNVWTWNVWLLVTLTGWCLVAKSVFYFLLPGPAIKQLLAWEKNQTGLYVSGVVSVVVGVALGYYAYLV